MGELMALASVFRDAFTSATRQALCFRETYS